MRECDECGTEFDKEMEVNECQCGCNGLYCSDCIDDHKIQQVEVEQEHECVECGESIGSVCSNCGEPLCENCVEPHAEECIESEPFENIEEYEKEKVIDKLEKSNRKG